MKSVYNSLQKITDTLNKLTEAHTRGLSLVSAAHTDLSLATTSLCVNNLLWMEELCSPDLNIFIIENKMQAKILCKILFLQIIIRTLLQSAWQSVFYGNILIGVLNV